MNIISMRTLDGPNVFTSRPVVLTTLDLEALHERESREFAGFNERLLECLPGLREHVCGKGYPGAFVERLHDGTYFGHIVEHVAIELGSTLQVAGNYGKTVRSPQPHCFDLIVESRVHPVTRYLIQRAVAGVTALVNGERWDVGPVLAEAERIKADTDLGPTTRAIVDAAASRGIPRARLNDQSLVQLGIGCRRRLIQSAMSDATSGIAMEIAQDKALTKQMLARAFVPVPRGQTVHTLAEALAVFEDIAAPIVIKPLDGNQGKGVSVGLRTVDEIAAAFAAAQQYSRAVLIEEMFIGDDYRLLVVGGRLVAASHRRPPCVVGDGRSTVAQLVAVVNEDPRRGEGHEKPLTRIRIDETAAACLTKQGLDAASIPEAGREVLLRDNANLSTGGTAADVTDRVHRDVRAMCERAARIVGLDICGVDLIAPDIAQRLGPGAGIVELNAAPGIRMHLHPSSGEPRDVATPIVDMLFPCGANGRIPLISITGTNGKTTVTRMIAHAIGSSGQRVGMTTTDGVWMDGRPVATGDMTGPRSAQAVLTDPAVEVAVLETARGGIVRSGLGYDWSDVGIITNIQLDHIGQDGIESIEDLAHIKSLVAERVREGGCLVMNADDDHVMRLLDEPRIARVPRELRLFSLYPNHYRVRRHVGGGGVAYVPRNGWIVEYAGSTQRRIVEVGEIPVALGGAAQFQLANAMAATAACRVYGLAPEHIAAALCSFNAEADNQGRGNLYRVGRGYVLLDYGHNPAALEAVGRMGARWFGRRFTGVVGVPGDRADWVIAESARVAAEAFHRIIVREDEDLRGRRRGEIPRLLCEAISRRAPSRDCQTVTNESTALRTALETMEDNEVIVVFYEDLSAVRSVLNAAGATPATRVDPLQIGADGVFRELRRA
jgi:cyanophycin synthetase